MDTFNLKLDHFAIRCKDKEKIANFYKNMFGYKEQERFDIVFNDGTKANSIALIKENNPDIFISDGRPGSLIDTWVKERNGFGIHHFAYLVEDIEREMERWQKAGFEFTTQEPIKCPDDDLVQCFTKPIPFMSNIIFEFITRGEKGFCLSSVKKLMESTDVNS